MLRFLEWAGRLGREEEEEVEDRVSDELRSISRDEEGGREEEEGKGVTAGKQIRFVTYHIRSRLSRGDKTG